MLYSHSYILHIYQGILHHRS